MVPRTQAVASTSKDSGFASAFSHTFDDAGPFHAPLSVVPPRSELAQLGVVSAGRWKLSC